MVIKTMLTNKKNGAEKPVPNKKDVIFVRSKITDKVASSASEQTVDVIDLGAPRSLRRTPPPSRQPYTPNPRLYPGPAAAKPKRKQKRSQGHAARSRRVFRRPVPNARLYRPAPRRAPPPPAPRRPWPPPAPALPALDTASRAALRLATRRRDLQPVTAPAPHLRAPAPPPRAPAPPPRAASSPPPAQLRSHRLVVTLPPAAAAMDNARHSTSPEDCSDGNDAVSAPSEFLAEFLSAIMQRQYAEALKYCRLILQYEPHNATARGFYPLLQHKVQKHNEGGGGAGGAGGGPAPAAGASRRGSLSDSSGAASSRDHSPSPSPRPTPGRWSGSESEGSVASQSSLELDSSSGSAPSSARDSNGNPPPASPTPPTPPAPPAPPTHPTPDDLENDNDVSATFQDCLQEPSAGAASLRRLRAHFACSIK